MHTHFDNGKLLVSIMQAAGLLSVGRSTIYKLIGSGDLKVVKLGCAARITMESIQALLADAGQEVGR